MTDQTAEAADRLKLMHRFFIAEADTCVRKARRKGADVAFWALRESVFRKDADAVATLLADRERLRLAMKPFAAVGRLIDRYFQKYGDAETFHSGAGWRDKEGNTKTLTLGDFRSAYAALSTQGEG